MMAYATGPALRKLTSDKSIHDGAQAEAEELTNVVKKLFIEGRKGESKKVAHELVKFWEQRIIAHADAEEEGLYLEIVEENHELGKDDHIINRDHDLMLDLIKHMKKMLEENMVTKDMMNILHACLLINDIHSRSEEELLDD